MSVPHALDPKGSLRLVIFDCDGVLIDSEAPAIRLILEEVSGLGLAITADEAVRRFAGLSLIQAQRLLEAETGRSLGPDWGPRLQERLVTLMREEAVPIEGAESALTALAALGLPFRVGSNSSHAEMDAKFSRVGFTRHIPRDRIHSANEMGRPKPDPHVYLHAAAREGVPAEQCVVIEDSDTGARAAQAAGMACVLLRPDGPMPADPWPGLVRIAHLDELVPLLARVKRLQGA
jgi:HAD superfamily hydrolase (TIGR01509 family)